MDMVSIPAGQFTMGVNEGPVDAKPAHQVKVDSFLMDQHEITQEVYEQVVGKNPSRRKNPQNPVEQVTWSAAVRFCNARSVQEGLTPCYDTNAWECDFLASGYRLPTEAEWECACRASTSTAYFFGDNPSKLGEYAWFDQNAGRRAQPVGQKLPNPWGLYDICGNVWQWCNDFYQVDYYQQAPRQDPKGPDAGQTKVSSSIQRPRNFGRSKNASGGSYAPILVEQWPESCPALCQS